MRAPLWLNMYEYTRMKGITVMCYWNAFGARSHEFHSIVASKICLKGSTKPLIQTGHINDQTVQSKYEYYNCFSNRMYSNLNVLP